MTENDTVTGAKPARTGIGVHVRSHGKALLAVGVASVLGIVASFAFQLISARFLSPADFGLLAAFFVIVNVAAIGSASLQSSVTVQTASALTAAPSGQRRRWPVDAVLLGVGGALVVAALSPWLASSLSTTPLVILAAAATIPLSFVFADAMGLLQGSGQVARAVWWSTFSQIARVAFAVLAIAVGTGLGGIVGAVLAALLVAVVGGMWTARRVPRPVDGVFSRAGITIVVLTVAFAWLTSSDVIFLRAGAPEDLAGMYASVTVLVKTGFLLPSTLSLYLLPRFVKHRDNPDLSRIGVLATLGLSVATSIVMVLVFLVLGPWIVALIYPEAYAPAADLLVPTALAYMPWIAAQGMMIKMTSSASPAAAVLLLVASAAQWVAFSLTIPDLGAMLTSYAIIGVVVLATFFAIDIRNARRLRSVVAPL
ncbi:oligosaccharide flippase family protein [uncultured Microbacterium sp.]|uniref:lipopolysaccharide biosynthesis protein n=1 Tax=uncultured Microbacterium sp. TaxID=191216 RepID=UPI0028DC5A09|nr:oligosaccharide flippase family protein [uncultured Microbacterium sp.]